jgi:hypothetical protein
MQRKLKKGCVGRQEQNSDDDEDAAFIGDEMAVLVSAQNMVRMVRKLHVAMLVMGCGTLALLITALCLGWYGESNHAKGALQGLTIVFGFVLSIMWLVRAESPTNILTLLFVMALASASLGIIC